MMNKRHLESLITALTALRDTPEPPETSLAFCYSSDNERFTAIELTQATTWEEAYAFAREELGPGVDVYVARRVPLTITSGTANIADVVTEQIACELQDDAGEVAEDYLMCLTEDEETELKVWLDFTLTVWANATHNQPNFYAVDDIKKYGSDGNDQSAD